jgi:voltage-gated potassium channel
MKFFPAILITLLADRASMGNLKLLLRFCLLLFGVMLIYTVLFQVIMVWHEGQQHSTISGFYWVVVTMTTLGFGDITFKTDLGRLFSVIVMLSGVFMLLVMLPFTFIEFLYAPWMKAQSNARAPRTVPPTLSGHVIIVNHGPVAETLIDQLNNQNIRHVLIVPDLPDALRLHDQGISVLLGELDDPDTYRRAGAERAGLVATLGSELVNTNVAFTVREISEQVPIFATARSDTAEEVLRRAGETQVLRLGHMLGMGMARRTHGGDNLAHVVGSFGDLLVAEAAMHHTPLVGRSLREARLRERLGVAVACVWERGRMQIAGPDTRIEEHTILVMVATRAQLDVWDETFCIYNANPDPVLVLGCGRVGRAAIKHLTTRRIAYRVIDLAPERAPDPQFVIAGNATDRAVLEKAGLMRAPTVLITTHDDDTNIFLTILCRSLRPDIQIISRVTRDRNVNTVDRGGADCVLSYASLGANAITNHLRRTNVLMVTEGLNLVRVKIPAELAGRSLKDIGLRSLTGCLVVAIDTPAGTQALPPPDQPLPADGDLLLVGDDEAEARFLARYRPTERYTGTFRRTEDFSAP